MKKIFGELNLTWPKIIISAIIIGVLIGGLNCVPALYDTSFRDPAIYFDFWILIGILIIMNSKSNLDSALKCFFFFLISQPLIYLVEVPFNRMGWGIFVYYKPWFIWTLLTIPMGFIGYYMKKNNWWGLLILLPMLGLTASEMGGFVNGFLYSFPHHILSYIFCVCMLIIYPLCIFDNKKIKITGLVISLLAIIILTAIPFIDKPTYETDILCSGDTYSFDDTYKVYLKDEQYGKLSIKMVDSIETYCVHAEFAKTGKTELTLESPEGEKQEFEITIGNSTYNIDEKE